MSYSTQSSATRTQTLRQIRSDSPRDNNSSSATTGPYTRMMRERAHITPVDHYQPPTTESEQSIYRHYLASQEYRRRTMNGEGSSRGVMGLNPQFISDLNEGLSYHGDVIENHQQMIQHTSERVDAIWAQVVKEKQAKEHLQRHMKIMWIVVLLMASALVYIMLSH